MVIPGQETLGPEQASARCSVIKESEAPKSMRRRAR